MNLNVVRLQPWYMYIVCIQIKQLCSVITHNMQFPCSIQTLHIHNFLCMKGEYLFWLLP